MADPAISVRGVLTPDAPGRAVMGSFELPFPDVFNAPDGCLLAGSRNGFGNEPGAEDLYNVFARVCYHLDGVIR